MAKSSSFLVIGFTVLSTAWACNDEAQSRRTGGQGAFSRTLSEVRPALDSWLDDGFVTAELRELILQVSSGDASSDSQARLASLLRQEARRRATSSTPLGPILFEIDDPLACQIGVAAALDAMPEVHEGALRSLHRCSARALWPHFAVLVRASETASDWKRDAYIRAAARAKPELLASLIRDPNRLPLDLQARIGVKGAEAKYVAYLHTELARGSIQVLSDAGFVQSPLVTKVVFEQLHLELRRTSGYRPHVLGVCFREIGRAFPDAIDSATSLDHEEAYVNAVLESGTKRLGLAPLQIDVLRPNHMGLSAYGGGGWFDVPDDELAKRYRFYKVWKRLGANEPVSVLYERHGGDVRALLEEQREP